MEIFSRAHAVKFSSGDNPITTIEFKENRGINLLKLETGSKYERSVHSFNLPVLVGGRNSSGKTSLLRSIELVTNMLQESRITRSQSEEVWSKLKSMNVSYFSITFSAEIGSPLPNSGTVIESLTEVEMNSEESDCQLKWRDGIQIRNPQIELIFSQKVMYPRYGQFKRTNKSEIEPYKRTISKHRIEKLIEKWTLEIEQMEQLPKLQNNRMLTDTKQKLSNYVSSEIQFQDSVLIDINRTGVEKELEPMIKVVPEVVKKYQRLSQSPELLRAEFDNSSINEWFSIMFGPAKNVIEQDSRGRWNMTMWAPEFLETMQEPYTGIETTPGWFRYEGNWATKKDAIEFVTEAALNDVVSWSTGLPQPKSFVNDSQGLSWKSFDHYHHPSMDYEKGKGVRLPPTLSVALRNPVIAKIICSGWRGKELNFQVDVLTRMNTFTPIEKITSEYLTSGQRQVLALIIGTRKAKSGSLILIDEPELSLHVDWQSALVEQLHARLTTSQLVIATHSPDITMNHLHLCNVLSTSSEGGDL